MGHGLLVLTCVLACVQLPLGGRPSSSVSKPLVQARVARPFTHDGPVHALGFSPDGRLLASAGSDKTVRIWDVALGRETQTLLGHQGTIYSVAFSPDGKTLASGSEDGTIAIWNVAKGKLLRRLPTDHRIVRSVAFSMDGNLLASGGADGKVCVRETRTDHVLRQLAGHDDLVSFVTFSPNGATLASGSGDGTVLLWDQHTGARRQRIEGDHKAVVSIAFSPDSKELAVGAFGVQPMHLWDVATGKEIRSFAQPSFLGYAAFSPRGRVLANVLMGYGGEAIQFWNADTGKELRRILGLESPQQCLAFSPDGRLLAAGDKQGSIRLWDTATGAERLLPGMAHGAGASARTLVGHRDKGICVAFSPNGKTLASGGRDKTLRLWDVETGQEKRQLVEHSARISCVQYSPNGKYLATAAADQTVIIRNPVNGQLIRKLALGLEEIPSISFDPSGAHLVTVNNEQGATLWNVLTGERVAKFGIPNEAARGLVFSPGGRMVAALGVESGVSLQRLVPEPVPAGIRGDSPRPSFLPGRTLQGDLTRLTCLAFSPDGKILAGGTRLGTKMVQLWEPATGKQLGVIPAPREWITAIAFSPDARILAWGSAENTIWLWDLLTSQPLHSFKGPAGYVNSLSFAADGKSLAVGSEDSDILIWNIEPFLPRSPLKSVALTAQDLARLWDDLGSGDERAYQARCALAAAPAQTVPFLEERLARIPHPDLRLVPNWIAQLDNDRYDMRARATLELEKLGQFAESFLRDALKNKPPLETLQRLKRLLLRLEQGTFAPDWLRGMRGISVLEWIGNERARQALQHLANSTAPDWIKTDAREAGARLASRL